VSTNRTRSRLGTYFVIAFALPIGAVLWAAAVDGLAPAVPTADLAGSSIVVLMAMIHAPLLAAIVASLLEAGRAGVRSLFGQLRDWRHPPAWYLRAVLVFPLAIVASMLIASQVVDGFPATIAPSLLVVGVVFSTLWEEIGWTGHATPRLLDRWTPLVVALGLGVIHTVWHLAADYWGSARYYGTLELYAVHFLLWLVGLVALRIIIVWSYVRTRSVVLAWLAHLGYTGGQLVLIPAMIPATATIGWNLLFVAVVLVVLGYLAIRDRSFRTAFGIGVPSAQPAA